MLFLRALAIAALAAGAVANSTPTYTQVGQPYIPADLAGTYALFGVTMVANAKGTEVFVSANLNQGSVSVLAYNGAKKTLTQKQRLLPTNPDVNGYGFRMALDPSGKVLAVAGKTSLDDPVVVDIYKKRGHAWTRTQTLSVPKYPQRNWGTALTMSQGGKILIVGQGDLDAFFVYRLGRDGQYTQIQGPVRPIPIDPAAEIFFANYVSLSKSGQYLAVGGGIGVWMYKWDKAQGIYVTMSNSALVPGSTGAVVLSPSGKDVAACYPAANNFNGQLVMGALDKGSKTYKVTQTLAPADADSFCNGLDFGPDGKRLAVQEFATSLDPTFATSGAVWIASKTGKAQWALVPPRVRPPPPLRFSNFGLAMALTDKTLFVSGLNVDQNVDGQVLAFVKKA